MPLKFKPAPGDLFAEGEIVDEGGIVPDTGAVFAPLHNPAMDLLRFLLSNQPAPVEIPPQVPELPGHRIKKRGT